MEDLKNSKYYGNNEVHHGDMKFSYENSIDVASRQNKDIGLTSPSKPSILKHMHRTNLKKGNDIMDKKKDEKIGKDGKPMKFSDEQNAVGEQFGRTPDEMADIYGTPADASELPASAGGDEMKEDEKKEDEKALKDQLKAIVDNPDTKESDKKQANELIAQLEELEQAEKNAQKFISEKGVAPVEEAMPVMPEAGSSASSVSTPAPMPSV